MKARPAIHTLGQATGLLARTWRPVLLFSLLTQAVVALVLSPFLLWVLAEALALARSSVVLNYDLASLALSLPGLLLGLLWAVATCITVVFTAGGLALILSASQSGRSIPLSTVFVRALGAIPRLPGRGAVWLALISAAAIPLVGALTSALVTLLLSPFGANPAGHWLPDEVREIAWVAPAILLIILLAAALYVRGFLTLHALVLERVSLTRSIRRSAELQSGNFLSVLRVLLLFHLQWAVIFGIGALLFGLGHALLLGMFAEGAGAAFQVAVALLLVIDTVVVAIGTALYGGQAVALATVLYFRYGGAVEENLGEAVLAPRRGGGNPAEDRAGGRPLGAGDSDRSDRDPDRRRTPPAGSTRRSHRPPRKLRGGTREHDGGDPPGG